MNARILGMLTLFATLLFAGTLGAQVNDRIRFQARLSDSGGAAITVGTSVEFNLYTTPTGGTSLWTETIVIVPNANGVFTTELGATTAFTGIDFSQPLYLGLTVDTDPEMTPRYLLTAQALAHYARNAGLLDGLDSSAFAQLGAAASTFTGDITAASFTGDGSGLTSLSSSALTGPLPTLDGSALTNLNASAISSGTLSDARLTANVPLLNAANNTFTGTVAAAQLTAPLVNATTVSGTTVSATTVSASTIIATVTGQFPTLTTTSLATLQSLQVNTTANVTGALTAGSLGGDGAALTNLNATNIASGTLADARLTGNVTLQGNAFNGNTQLVQTTAAGLLPALDGSLVTNVNALTLLGNNWASPAAIGGTTPNSGAFTTLSSSALATLNSLSVTGAAGTDTLNVASTSSLTGAVTLGNDAATPVAGTVAIHDDQAANAFTGTMRVQTGGLTGNRTYSLPDNTGTLALLSDITGGGSTGSFTTLSSSGLATLNSLSVTNNAGVGGNLTVTGGVTAASFTGNGAALTNLDASALTTGTVAAARLTGSYAIDITGNAATATNAANLGGQNSAFHLARANHTGLLPDAALTGTYTGALTLNNVGNAFTGTFTGNGAALTNVDASTLGGQNSAFHLARANHTGALPDAALTGTYTGALTLNNVGNAFTGTFTGNGAALTNLDAGALATGTVAAARLTGSYAIDITGNAATATSATTAATATNALNLGGQNSAFHLARANHTGALPDAALTGTYTGALTLSNVGNAFTGTFTGSGAALTNLDAGALATGTVAAARLTGSYAIDITGNAATATSATTAATATNALNLGGQDSAFHLARINHTGALPDAALTGTYTGALTLSNLGNAFTGSFTGSGAALTNLDAGALATGTVAAARLTGSYAIDITGNAATATSATTATSASSVPAAGIIGAVGYGQLNLAGSIVGSDLAANIGINTTGGITAASFTGNGSALTNVDAALLGGLARTGFAELTGAAFTGGISAPAVTVTSTALTTDLQFSATPGALAADFTGASFLTNVATAGANAVRGTEFSVLSGGTAETQGVSVGTEHTAVIASPGALAGMPDVVGLFAEARNTNATSTTLSIGMIGSADITQAGVNVGVVGSAGSSTYQSFGLVGMANASRADVETFSDAFAGQSAALLLLNTQAAAGNYGLYVEATNNVIDGDLFVTGTINATVTGTASNSLALLGATWAAPGTIGSTTPNSGAFTTLSSSGLATLDSLTVTNAVTAASFTGNGAALTNLDAGALASGTVPAARLTGSYAIDITGNAATATSATTAATATNALNLGGQDSAFHLARVNHTGALPDAALTGTYTGALTLNNVGNAFTGTFTGSGAALTSLDAGALASGTVPAARLTGSYAIDITGNAATATSATSAGSATTAATATNALNLGGVPAANYALSANVLALGGGIMSGAIDLNTNDITNGGTITATNFVGGGAGLTGVTAASVAANNVTDGNLTLATGNLTLTGGTLTVSANTSSFTAPLATPGATYTAHDFVSSVDANAANTSRTLRALMTGTNAGTAEVTGAWLEAIGDGDITQGAFGQAVYTGGLGGGTAIGVDGRARSFIGGQALLAIGTAGRADDAQLGSNIGVHAWAANGGKDAGIFAVANASQAQQQTFDGTLPAGFSAAVLGFNNLAAGTDFGLYVDAANNRIVGNLTVTGTINGSISGTAGDSDLLDGLDSLDFVRSTGALSQVVTGTKTYTGSAFFGNTAGAPGNLAVTNGTVNTITVTGGTGSISATGTISAATFVGALTGNADTATNSLNLGGLPAANYALSANVLALAGGTMTGAINLGTNNITNGGTITATSFVGALTGNADTATTAATATNALSLGGTVAADYALSANVLALGGGTMTGAINLGTNDITNGGTITATSFVGALTGNADTATTAATATNSLSLGGTVAADYALSANVLALGGGTMSGAINLNANDITNGGTITATTFVGALTGNATTATSATTATTAGNALNLGGTPAANYALSANVLALGGGTMSGAIDLGTNDITNGGTITATTFVGALNLSSGNITNGGSASLTSATVTGAVVAGSVAANPGNSTANITNVPHWIEVAIPAFAGAGTSEQQNLIQLPAGAVVHAVKLKHSTSYSAGNTAYTISVGTSAAPTSLLNPFDVFQAVSGTALAGSNVLGTFDHTAPTQLVVQATASSATGGSGGAGTVWLLVSIAD